MINRFRKKLVALCRELIAEADEKLNDVLPSISLLPFVDRTVCYVCGKGKIKLFMLCNIY